ncbi:MAG: hypothetical protein R3B84_02385 [Zavarzinella sp.]
MIPKIGKHEILPDTQIEAGYQPIALAEMSLPIQLMEKLFDVSVID